MTRDHLPVLKHGVRDLAPALLIPATRRARQPSRCDFSPWRIVELTGETDELNARITAAVSSRAPELQRYGVGPDTAAALLLAAATIRNASPARHPSRHYAESAPSRRHRARRPADGSNRGGDRQTNSALYTIAIARLRLGRRTQDYVKRRVGEGKTCREAIRCLKRYICRDITTTRNTPATAQSAT